jgi:hypothetical protein
MGMPSDEDFINLDKRAEDLEEAELQDVKEIKALKAEIADCTCPEKWTRKNAWIG